MKSHYESRDRALSIVYYQQLIGHNVFNQSVFFFFLAALCRFAWACSSCGGGGGRLLFAGVHGLLMAVASLLRSSLSGMRASAQQHVGQYVWRAGSRAHGLHYLRCVSFVAAQLVESFRTRD